MSNDQRDKLVAIFRTAVSAVAGHESVVSALGNHKGFVPSQIIAVGKAAGEMCLGAFEVYDSKIPSLVVTKYKHTPETLRKYQNVEIVESGHPTPDENSLKAGQKIIDCVNSLGSNDTLLLLVSGGASALAESLPSTTSLEQWQALTEDMLASGKNIGQINTTRKKISLIKDGRLLEAFDGRQALTCAISDVEGDSISVIGSGIGDTYRCKSKSDVKLIASNKIARMRATAKAESFGLDVKQSIETLYDDVEVLSINIGEFIRKADKGVYIWGGEPTIVLPDNPGNGGRNQSLALSLAREILGRDNITILVAGTDGTDGPTDAAGGIVDSDTFQKVPGAQQALTKADAGSYLRQCKDIFITGPTGTNVMDLIIAIVD